MNYELARQLKAAGFPQFGEGHALIPNKLLPESDETMEVVSWRDFIRLNHQGEFLYAPTLPELIEACGKQFKTLHFHQERYKPSTGQWSAQWRERKGVFKKVWGHTPEEAVARLYLSLYGRKD